MALFKVEFATVRQLEKKSFCVFGYGGGALLVGLVLMFTGLPFIGLPLMLISAAVLLLGIAWVSVLGRESHRSLFCPYCSSRNDVYHSRRSFNCDICDRPVIVSEDGEPQMSEAIDTEARYDR